MSFHINRGKKRNCTPLVEICEPNTPDTNVQVGILNENCLNFGIRPSPIQLSSPDRRQVTSVSHFNEESYHRLLRKIKEIQRKRVSKLSKKRKRVKEWKILKVQNALDEPAVLIETVLKNEEEGERKRKNINNAPPGSRESTTGDVGNVGVVVTPRSQHHLFSRLSRIVESRKDESRDEESKRSSKHPGAGTPGATRRAITPGTPRTPITSGSPGTPQSPERPIQVYSIDRDIVIIYPSEIREVEQLVSTTPLPRAPNCSRQPSLKSLQIIDISSEECLSEIWHKLEVLERNKDIVEEDEESGSGSECRSDRESESGSEVVGEPRTKLYLSVQDGPLGDPPTPTTTKVQSRDEQSANSLLSTTNIDRLKTLLQECISSRFFPENMNVNMNISGEYSQSSPHSFCYDDSLSLTPTDSSGIFSTPIHPHSGLFTPHNPTNLDSPLTKNSLWHKLHDLIERRLLYDHDPPEHPHNAGFPIATLTTFYINEDKELLLRSNESGTCSVRTITREGSIAEGEEMEERGGRVISTQLLLKRLDDLKKSREMGEGNNTSDSENMDEEREMLSGGLTDKAYNKLLKIKEERDYEGKP